MQDDGLVNIQGALVTKVARKGYSGWSAVKGTASGKALRLGVLLEQK